MERQAISYGQNNQVQQYSACPTPARTSPFEQAGTVGEKRFLALPFDFTVTGGDFTQTYRITIGWKFVVYQINAYYETDVTFNIRDDFRTEYLFINPVRIDLITGDGRLPYTLPAPYPFEAGTSITVIINDPRPIGSPSANIQIVLIGYKEFIKG